MNPRGRGTYAGPMRHRLLLPFALWLAAAGAAVADHFDPPVWAALEAKVEVRASDSELGELLSRLFAGSGLDAIVIPPAEVEPDELVVTLSLPATPRRVALTTLLKLFGMTYSLRARMVIVHPPGSLARLLTQPAMQQRLLETLAARGRRGARVLTALLLEAHTDGPLAPARAALLGLARRLASQGAVPVREALASLEALPRAARRPNPAPVPRRQRAAVARWTTDLGSAVYGRRRAAARALLDVGPPALAALRRAARSSDLEVRLQAASLARQIAPRARRRWHAVEVSRWLGPGRWRVRSVAGPPLSVGAVAAVLRAADAGAVRISVEAADVIGLEAGTLAAGDRLSWISEHIPPPLSKDLARRAELDLEGLAIEDPELEQLRGHAALRRLSLRGCVRPSPRALAWLAQLDGLRSLCLDGTRIDDPALAALGRLGRLTALSLAGCAAPTGAGLSSLAGLETLDLSACPGLTTRGLAALGGARRLTSLDLADNPQLVDGALTGLPRLTRLRSLWLSRCAGLSDESLAVVGRLPALETLSIGGCTGLSASGLAALQSLRRLRQLEAAIPGLDDRALVHIGQLVALEQLWIVDASGAVPDGTLFSDAGLAELAGLPALRELRLHGCGGVEGAGLEDWPARLRALQTLELGHCRALGDEGLARLAALPALRALTLLGCRVRVLAPLARSGLTALSLTYDDPHALRDPQLAVLGRMGALRSLTLRRCAALTDAGVRELSGLRQLRELALGCPGLTGVGLQQLARLPALQTLRLNGCHGIRDGALERFRAARSGVAVSR